MEYLLNQVWTITVCGGIILGLFVSLLLNNKRAKRSRANLYLSILLLSFVFSLTHMLFAGRIMNRLSVNTYPVGDPTLLLISPLLWFYIIELTGGKVKWFNSIIHFIPFLLVISCSLFFRNLVPGHSRQLSQIVVIGFWVIVLGQFTAYQIIIRKKWLQYQRFLNLEVSNTEDVNIDWIRFFLGVFWIINLFFLFSLFAVIHLNYVTWLVKAIAFLFSLSIFALGYKGILQKEIFHIDIPEKPSLPLPEPEAKIVDQDLKERLLSYMDSKKPFLDPELTLSGLAKDINISRSQLSLLINEGTGDNFYNFVNKYRVEQVKQFMTDPALKNYSMLGIALEAGFKSKSTFNLIFKRFTGLTPTEFRKNLS